MKISDLLEHFFGKMVIYKKDSNHAEEYIEIYKGMAANVPAEIREKNISTIGVLKGEFLDVGLKTDE